MEPACAYALSVEAADDTNTVVLRCSTHGVLDQVVLDDDAFSTRIAEWFDAHALCTRVVVPSQRACA